MDDFIQISVEKAHEIIGAGDVTIIDIRNPDAYAQGHIAHSKLINDENIDAFLKEADKEQPVICYCYHGISSQQASRFLVKEGFKKVYSIIGGWEEWKKSYA